MPTVDLSNQTFRALQDLAEPLVDTPEAVIRRLIEEHEQRQEDEVTGNGEGPSAHRERQRAKKGEKTPNEAFYGPIVKVLRDAGGELRAKEVVDRVGELMEEELNEVDRAELKSGEIRWRNTVRFARHDLVKSGKLASDAPFGTWQLADADSD